MTFDLVVEDLTLGKKMALEKKKLREKICITEEQCRDLMVRAQRYYVEVERAGKTQKEKVHPSNYAPSFFFLLDRDYPGKFIYRTELSKVIDEKMMTHFIKWARKQWLKKGKLIYSKHSIGHRFASIEEMTEEYLKGCMRGAGHLGQLHRNLDVINWTTEIIEAMPRHRQEDLNLAVALCDSAKKFLRGMNDLRVTRRAHQLKSEELVPYEPRVIRENEENSEWQE